MSTVAVLGLGAMGRGVAANVVAAGHCVRVWNRTAATAEEFASGHASVVAATPRAAAAGADVVISMVTDDDASRAVWLDPADGAVHGVGHDAIVVESSTVSPGWVVELADAIGRARFVEAPVVGSRPQLAARQLTSLVGGDVGVLEAVRPVLAASSGRIEHVGAIGDAARLKLLVNALFAVQVAAYAEVMGVIERSSVDTAVARSLLESLPITSPAMQRILGLVADRDFAPNFPIDLVAKDLRYAVDGAPGTMPLTTAARDVFARAAADGWGGDDIAGVAQRYLPTRVASA